MDNFDFDNVKAEKAKAILRYNRLRTLAKLFRLLELCLALLLLSWISSRLPMAFRISGEYFRLLVSIVVSPLFIFLISNAIVITLLAKSGQLSGQNSAGNNAGSDFCEEFIKNRTNEIHYPPENCPPVPEPEAIVCEEKQIVSEVNSVAPKSDDVKIAVDRVSDEKAFRRSKSEILKREISEKSCAKLRRSETEKFPEVSPETMSLVEELSNEEFQRAVEEFIAKQVKFHKEEKLTIVPCS